MDRSALQSGLVPRMLSRLLAFVSRTGNQGLTKNTEKYRNMFSMPKILPLQTLSGKHFKTVLLHNCQQLARHPAGLLATGFPLLDRRFAAVEVFRKSRLANVGPFADFFDLFGLQRCRHRQARRFELAHGCLINRAHFLQRSGRDMNYRKVITFEFLFLSP